MAPLFWCAWSAFMFLAARWVCGKWASHLSFYTFVWTASILAYETHLITYHRVVFEAWAYVFVAWVSLYLGTAIVTLSGFPRRTRQFPELDMKWLRNALVLLSVAGFASSLVLAGNIVRTVDSDGLVSALLQYGNQIYGLRVEGELSGILYVAMFPYAGCVLAGIYTARLGRISIAAMLPLLAMLVDGLLSFQRTGMFVGVLLLAFSYLLTPKAAKLRVSRWQKLALIGVVLGGFLLVTVARGPSESFEGESSALAEVGDLVPMLPSLYFYASAPIPCFSEYLQHPENEGKSLWGRYMFASIYRLFSKFGFDTYVSYYPAFYYTPEPTNAGTYLREIHSDFGGLAVFFFPFMLGMLVAVLEYRGGIVSVVLGAFLYVAIFFSFDVNFISGGSWYFPLPLCLFMTWLLTRKQPSTNVQTAQFGTGMA